MKHGYLHERHVPDENVKWVNRIMQPKNWNLQWDVKVKKIEPCMSIQLFKFSCVQKCLLVIVKKTLKVILICQTVKKHFFQDQAQYVWKWRVNAFCKTIQSCLIGLVWPNMAIEIKSEYMYGTYREFWESEICDTKLQRCETIMIMHLDQHILSFLEKGCQELLICTLAKLTATKKKTQAVKTCPSSETAQLTSWQTTHGTPQPVLIYTQLAKLNSLHHWTFHSQKVPKSCFLWQ